MILRWKGDVKKARQVLDRATGKVDMARFTPELVTLDLCDRDYESALRRLSPTAISSYTDTAFYYLMKAEVYSLLTDSTQSRAYYDSARLFYESHLAIVAGLPQSLRAFATLGLAGAYAGLGRKEDAIRLAQKAGEQLPVSKDALFGAMLAEYRAQVYVKVGEYDLAIDQLELLFSIPSNITVPGLRLDPGWDPLRTHPRFQALLKKYG
jgi:tetratricopeptide (TPR) repeat protein